MTIRLLKQARTMILRILPDNFLVIEVNMHDIDSILKNPDEFDKKLAMRGLTSLSQQIILMNNKLKSSITSAQSLRTKKNELANLIGSAKKNNVGCEDLEASALKLKEEIAQAQQEERLLQAELESILLRIPNTVDDSVPYGMSSNDNVEIRKFGVPREFDFPVRSHFQIGESLDMMDFQMAAKISGSRFTILKGPLAQLERAVAAFMLDIHTGEFGYQEISVPVLVRRENLIGTGQIPNLEEDLFVTKDGRYLVPTAEVPLTNFVRDNVLDVSQLPMRLTAYTQCFRGEAGAAGKDTRGMIRNHQFGKVELVSIVRLEDQIQEHERMTSCAESILKRLELPYRVMLLCSGDIGFSSKKTYDLEVWIPSENTYREISSCSVCGTFQAMRMNAKYKNASNPQDRGFVCTLNGSGLAVGRTVVAIIENYQQKNGTITIPEVLVNYMHGQKEIKIYG